MLRICKTFESRGCCSSLLDAVLTVSVWRALTVAPTVHYQLYISLWTQRWSHVFIDCSDDEVFLANNHSLTWSGHSTNQVSNGSRDEDTETVMKSSAIFSSYLLVLILLLALLCRSEDFQHANLSWWWTVRTFSIFWYLGISLMSRRMFQCYQVQLECLHVAKSILVILRVHRLELVNF